MIFHDLGALLGVGFADVTEPIAHDEQTLHARVCGTTLEIREKSFIARLVEIEGIDVLDRVEVEVVAGHSREVHRVSIPAEEGPVQRPLCERDPHREYVARSVGG